MSSLKARLYSAASVDAGLVALLGSSPFRWFDQRLPQGRSFPAVVVEMVSDPGDYVASGKMPTGWVRCQFRIYGSGNDSENANTVARALTSFLNTFDGPGIPGLATYPNLITNDMDMGIAQTDPLTFMRLVDVRLYINADA